MFEFASSKCSELKSIRQGSSQISTLVSTKGRNDATPTPPGLLVFGQTPSAEISMAHKPNLLQKITLIIGKLCFVLSVLSGIFLYIKVDELGMGHPVSASLLASIFFFLFVGILLSIAGGANIPNLRFSAIGKEE